MRSALLSCHILAKNSERRLAEVLRSVQPISDEILIVDSGSTDRTMAIVNEFKCKALHRPFDNFRDQRTYAEENCEHDWVLVLDSDEVASKGLQKKIISLKENSFSIENNADVDGLTIKRDWHFINSPVQNFYTVKAPEFIAQQFNKKKISHRNSRVIHEQVDTRGAEIAAISEWIHHHSCDSIDDLYAKIPIYARLSADDLHSQGIKSSRMKREIYPWMTWFRWYVLYMGFLDGRPGIILGKYARDTIRTKYNNLAEIQNQTLRNDSPDGS